jgi:phosphopantetheinyl transferase
VIRWLVARPGPGLDGKSFLCPQEAEEGKRYRHPGRYRQWLLGRAAAKTLLARHAKASGDANLPPALIHVKRTQEGWPEPMRAGGQPLAVSLSISHSGDKAFCVLCPDEEGTLGADIESIAARSPHFLEDYYTESERQRLSALPTGKRDWMATVFWCIKEAALKARRTGFHESADSVNVISLESMDARTWKNAEVVLKDGIRPEAYWRVDEGGKMALAIVRLRPQSARPGCVFPSNGREPATHPDPNS